MTINATAAILLALYQAVARRQGTDAARLRGTIQNDILKEYIARGTYIFPPEPSMRLVTDTFAYCRAELPAWNTISISGYHMREAGSTAAQEVAFTIANAIAYADAARGRRAGLRGVRAAPLLLLRRPQRPVRGGGQVPRGAARLGHASRASGSAPRSRESQAMRFHVQTGGSTLTAQQPDTNVVRTTVQALSAVLGGAQSLHTNALDEALGLPTPVHRPPGAANTTSVGSRVRRNRPGGPAGRLVLRRVADRRAGASGSTAELAEIDRRGGTLAALADGYQQGEIAQAAYEFQRAVEAGESIIVGVNAFSRWRR